MLKESSMVQNRGSERMHPLKLSIAPGRYRLTRFCTKHPLTLTALASWLVS
jgi:hypothetical protein